MGPRKPDMRQPEGGLVVTLVEVQRWDILNILSWDLKELLNAEKDVWFIPFPFSRNV